MELDGAAEESGAEWPPRGAAASSPAGTVGRYFTKTQEWFQVDNEDGTGTVGITQAAQRALGEIVFCRLPREGERFEVMDTLCTLEAVKTTAEVKCPVAGEVIEVNPRLLAEPALISMSPLTEGWLVRLDFGERLPRYLLRSRAVIRTEVEPLLADLPGLQAFLSERLGNPAVTDDVEAQAFLRELTFSGLNSQERLWIHKAAQDFGFTSISRGAGAGRQLVVRRPAPQSEPEDASLDMQSQASRSVDAADSARDDVGRGRRHIRRGQ